MLKRTNRTQRSYKMDNTTLGFDGLLYITIVVTLGVVMVLLIFHYFRPKNKEHVEQAKYTIFDEDDDMIDSPKKKNGSSKTSK